MKLHFFKYAMSCCYSQTLFPSAIPDRQPVSALCPAAVRYVLSYLGTLSQIRSWRCFSDAVQQRTLFIFSEVFPQKAKRSKFQEKPHLEGAEFTKSSQLVVKTAAEILCHCSYALSAEEKQVGRVNRTKTIRVFWSDGSCIEQFPPEFMLPKTTTIVGYS